MGTHESRHAVESNFSCTGDLTQDLTRRFQRGISTQPTTFLKRTIEAWGNIWTQRAQYIHWPPYYPLNPMLALSFKEATWATVSCVSCAALSVACPTPKCPLISIGIPLLLSLWRIIQKLTSCDRNIIFCSEKSHPMPQQPVRPQSRAYLFVYIRKKNQKKNNKDDTNVLAPER